MALLTKEVSIHHIPRWGSILELRILIGVQQKQKILEEKTKDLEGRLAAVERALVTSQKTEDKLTADLAAEKSKQEANKDKDIAAVVAVQEQLKKEQEARAADKQALEAAQEQLKKEREAHTTTQDQLKKEQDTNKQLQATLSEEKTKLSGIQQQLTTAQASLDAQKATGANVKMSLDMWITDHTWGESAPLSSLRTLDKYIDQFGKIPRIDEVIVYEADVEGIKVARGATFRVAGTTETQGAWFFANEKKATLTLDIGDYVKSIKFGRSTIRDKLFITYTEITTKNGKVAKAGTLATDQKTFTAPDGMQIVSIQGAYGTLELSVYNRLGPLYALLGP